MLVFFEEFEKQIKNLYEVEIGDFKRKSVSYLNNLLAQAKDSSYRSWGNHLREMIVCNQTTEVDVLRNCILEEISKKTQKK